MRTRSPIARRVLVGTIALAAAILTAVPASLTAAPALAASPTPNVMYQLPSNAECTKERGACVVYPKAVGLPNGRLVASFERATTGPTGTAYDQTLPIYKSDDDGTTWQFLTNVRAPAFLGGPSQYVSNWTNPYLYVMPQTVGSLTAGTLVMATVVSGEDEYFREQKQANPNFVGNGDGDRPNMAIALYKSTDNGATWSYVNILARGGWQGGSVGATGRFAKANTYGQVDPVWEPFLMVHNNKLINYYSDENDYTGANWDGSLIKRTDNDTGPDSWGQVLAHTEWDGISANAVTGPYLDVAGGTDNVGGVNVIGGGRPGMPNVAAFKDGKFLLTYEFCGHGVSQKISSDPLNFRSADGACGNDIAALPVTAGSPTLNGGNNPVVVTLPDGRLIYNAGGSGDVWVNEGGTSTSPWTRQFTTSSASYSRNLTYIPRTGRVAILNGFGTSVQFADVDFGRTVGTYYELVNVKSGKVLDSFGASLADGTNLVQWGDNGGFNQQWHVTDIGNGYKNLLNRQSGRAAAINQVSTADGAPAVAWVQNLGADQAFTLVPAGSNYKIVARHSGKLLTVAQGSTADGARIIQWPDQNLAEQQWTLVPAN